MVEKINEEVLCVLKYQGNDLIINYEPIEKHFLTEIKTFKQLCEVNYDNLKKILGYLTTTETLKPLEKHYKYCQKLDGSFQEFNVSFEEKFRSLTQDRNSYYHLEKTNENYSALDRVLELQNKLLEEFRLWCFAYSIEKTYRKCYNNKNILTFSHRISGWSNPEYHLNDNFTIELKTNFGYGSASYFYVKIKYKNIEITPLSEWIDYEIAKFSEIVRYTKSFAYRFLKGIYNNRSVYSSKIENGNWQGAMEFTKVTCNLSMQNEEEFIKKYIIGECEKMVNGLEKISSNNKFSFLGANGQHYNIDKHGHLLMEFRGEKISGALDFINKILEFKKIAEVNLFIKKIEELNRKIAPLLKQEEANTYQELSILNTEENSLKPKYLDLEKKNQNYAFLKNTMKINLIKSNDLNSDKLDFEKLDLMFLAAYPEYNVFKVEFNKISAEYNLLKEKIRSLEIIHKNIQEYNRKIRMYFLRTAL